MTRLLEYARLMRLDRPIGFWLLLWPALWALWISADGQPGERVFAIFVAGTFLMRAAGCVINDYADRRIDPHVRRTAARPLARGAVSPAEALGLFVVLACCCVAAARAARAADPAVRARRRRAGGDLSVPQALFPAARRPGSAPRSRGRCRWRSPSRPAAFPSSAWLLFAAAVLWTMVYDTMYAMVDREDDLALGVRSVGDPVRARGSDRRRASAAGGLALLVVVGRLSALGRWFWLGLVGGGAFLPPGSSWLIREREPSGVLPRVPQQQLLRHGRVRRYRARLSLPLSELFGRAVGAQPRAIGFRAACRPARRPK